MKSRNELVDLLGRGNYGEGYYDGYLDYPNLRTSDEYDLGFADGKGDRSRCLDLEKNTKLMTEYRKPINKDIRMYGTHSLSTKRASDRIVDGMERRRAIW